MTALATLERRHDISVLSIDNPPVNALSSALVAAIRRSLEQFDADPASRALVIVCQGSTWVAGGDINEFANPAFSAEGASRLMTQIAAQQRPVIAAMHGTVLGGGLELALACHWRVAAQGTTFGLPEVRLGLLPGALGTQLLPRLVGIPLALDLISSGRTLDLPEAMRIGLVDVQAPGDVLQAALDLARDVVAKPIRRTTDMSVDREGAQEALDAARERAQALHPPQPAAAAIVRCVQASQLPLTQGSAVEAAEFAQLVQSRESRALRHLFKAQREAPKVPAMPADVRPRALGRLGVLGAGTMGRGIAMTYISAGIPTVLVDVSQSAVDAAVGAIRQLFEDSAKKGRLTAAQVEQRMALLQASADDRSLAGCDLVIEVVFEELELKLRTMRRLGEICRPGAVIATNTSTLDVNAMAEASGRPESVVGLHYFVPAHVMRLLEIVRGDRIAPDVLATALQLARRTGKVPVVAGVCYGFIGNRMVEVYLREADFLIQEGASPAQVDEAVESMGMAMGPCRMSDLAGVDVNARIVNERAKAGKLPADPAYRAVVRRLADMGRYGQKTGAGFYHYEGRRAVPDPVVETVAVELAAQNGIARRLQITQQEIRERLLYSMVNEAANILEEGIAYRPGDIDVVYTVGYGFPGLLGGPLFMADEIGLAAVLDRVRAYGAGRAGRFGYWAPSPLLSSLAASGRRMTDFNPGR